MSGLLVPAKTTTLVAVLNPENIAKKTKIKTMCHQLFRRIKHSGFQWLLSPTIHLHQQLIQRVLLLTLHSEVSSPSFPTHSIDLVDEEDARGIL